MSGRAARTVNASPTLAARKRLEATLFENVDHVLPDQDLILDHQDDGVFVWDRKCS